MPGISFVTTAPEPTKQYSPKTVPQIIVAFAPIETPLLIKVPEYFLFVGYSDLGLITFVNTALGPIKTLSLMITPS